MTRATPSGSPRSVFSLRRRTSSPPTLACCSIMPSLRGVAISPGQRTFTRMPSSAQLRLQRHAQAVHAALARPVGYGAAPARHARARRDHQDHPAASQTYGRYGVLGRQEAPLEVHVDSVVPHLLGYVLDRHHRVASDACRRHQAVDAAHSPHCLSHQPAHLGLDRHVGPHEPGLAAHLAYPGNAVRAIGLVHVGDHYARAHGGAMHRRRAAYPRSSAGHHHALAVQVHSRHLMPASTPVL